MKNLHKLYILMRTDLNSLNPGKAMAQSAHAANQFIANAQKIPEVKQWQAEGGGFGTTIVLATTLPQIESLVDVISTGCFKIESNSFGIVVDDTYPYKADLELASLIPSTTDTAPRIYNDNGTVTLFRIETTCAYIFLEEGNEQQHTLISHLKLHS